VKQTNCVAVENIHVGLPEKSKWAQHAFAEGYQICENAARILLIETNIRYTKSRPWANMTCGKNPVSI
jgi:hypothetical protein